MSDSFIIGPRILLSLLWRRTSRGVLLLFVDNDHFLVQEQLEILQTTLDIAVFPEPILSSADVVQRILDFDVASRLPSAVYEDSVLT